MKQPNPKLNFNVGFIMFLLMSIPLLYTNQTAFRIFVTFSLILILLYVHVFSKTSKDRREVKGIIKQTGLKSLEHMTNDSIILISAFGALLVSLGVFFATSTVEIPTIFIKVLTIIIFIFVMYQGFSMIYHTEIEERPASLKHLFNGKKDEFEQIFFSYKEELEVQKGYMAHALEVASKFNRWVEVQEIIEGLQREKLALTEQESLQFQKLSEELEQLKNELQLEKKFLLDAIGLNSLEVNRTKHQSDLIKKMEELEK